MARSLEAITEDMMKDRRPSGPDGCSTKDRIAFVSQVMGAGAIDLTASYDYGSVARCEDSNMVEAMRHLAILQLDYLHRQFEHEHIDEEDYTVHSGYLILAVQRINWHLSHLRDGQPTPPFPHF